MKTIKSLFITVFIMSGIIISGCDSKDETISINEVEEEADAIYKATTVLFEETVPDPVCLSEFPIEDLNEIEIEALSQMREEELLARDIYLQLYEIYEYPVFEFIAKSEAWHTAVVKFLIDRYELTDPAVEHKIGVFNNQHIQELHDALLSKGQLSGTDALEVGATIEDVDIYDLQNLLANGIDNQDITCAFQNLTKGSRNHIRAFVRVLSYGGNSYTPQYLTQDEFDYIISLDHEVGPVDCNN